MPGMFGCYLNNSSTNELEYTLQKMGNMLVHSNGHKNSYRVLNENLGGGNVFIEKYSDKQQLVSQDKRYHIWFDGEVYNKNEVSKKYNAVIASNPELILHLFTTCDADNHQWLIDLDGVFTVVIADLKDKKLYMFNDRFGLKHLYWLHTPQCFFWCSELKGMLSINDLKLSIDKLAVKEFFSFGYLLEDRTWFQGVKLLPHAAMLEYNWAKDKVTSYKYWNWSDIKEYHGKIDLREAAEHINELFVDGIRRRTNPKERVAVTLSGGLDSRYIFASLPKECSKLCAITFGKEGCADFEIAKQVTKVRKTPHIFCEIDTTNWLERRPDEVFLSDGQLNILHMHGIESYKEIEKNGDVIFNGYLGDAVLGGSYMEGPKDIFEKIFLKDSFIDEYAAHDLITSSGRSKEQYLIDNRGRRFILFGKILMDNIVKSRLPFFDCKLLDMVFSLPVELRKDSLIYKIILLNSFPEYFKSIPWQTTMSPISYGDKRRKIYLFKRRCFNKIKRMLNLTNIPYWKTGYTDYPNWIRSQPARDYIESCILQNSALYPEYIDRKSVERIVMSHMAGNEEHSNMIGLILTFELWLQYVNNPKQVFILTENDRSRQV